MRRHDLQRFLPALVLVSLSCLWLAGCARQEIPLPVDKPPASAARADRAAEEAAIRQALHRYLEATGQGSAEEQNVDLAQVSIDSGYALVTWKHEREGGQAVLQSQAGGWKVLDCGPGWLGLEGVCKDHVPVEVAKRLLDEIDPNWPSYETF
jgi:hypothetical protein